VNNDRSIKDRKLSFEDRGFFNFNLESRFSGVVSNDVSEVADVANFSVVAAMSLLKNI
jgi:hypothetical protein